eukprot:1081200-Rhodomonas_salina.2
MGGRGGQERVAAYICLRTRQCTALAGSLCQRHCMSRALQTRCDNSTLHASPPSNTHTQKAKRVGQPPRGKIASSASLLPMIYLETRPPAPQPSSLQIHLTRIHPRARHRDPPMPDDPP